jgi:hypothetical protein
LVQEIPVHVDAVRLREVLGDELADGGQVQFLLVGLILHIFQGECIIFRCGLAHGQRAEAIIIIEAKVDIDSMEGLGSVHSVPMPPLV